MQPDKECFLYVNLVKEIDPLAFPQSGRGLEPKDTVIVSGGSGVVSALITASTRRCFLKNV